MAILVILYHLFSWIGPPPSLKLGFAVDALGKMAVPVFWCLSGFIFFAVYGVGISERSVSLQKFALARFSRLYPLAFATLIVTLGLSELYFWINNSSFVYHRGDVYHLLLNTFMASHWGFQKFTAYNGPIWSVSAEVLVYVLFYGVVRFFGKSPVVAIVVLLLGKVLARFEPNLTDHYSISTCIQVFFAGGITYAIYEFVLRRPIIQRSLISSAIIVCLVLVIFFTPERVSFQLVPPLTVLSFQLCLRKMPNKLDSLADYLGSVTYASYLLHYPIVTAVVMLLDKFGHSRLSLVSYPGCVLFLTVVVIASRTVYVKFEVPVQQYIRKVGSSKLSA
jgi:peptidoglycan/LPS O-acetylase OafA/YrhL